MKNNNQKRTETDEEIIIDGNLELTEDFKTSKNLIVKGRIFGKDGIKYNINAGDINAGDINAGNINAWDIDAGNINAKNIDAWDINAGDIICETRKKKRKTAKTICRVYVKNRSQIERKEHDEQ